MAQEKYLIEGELLRTRENAEAISSLSGLCRAMEEGRTLEAVARVCGKDMSIGVDLCGVRGVIPREEAVLPVGQSEIKDIAVITRVGKPVCFKVKRIIEDEYGAPVAVLSRRDAQRECLENRIKRLHSGDVIPARITHMEQFGAFVDVGCGIVSLLTIDAISVSRISHPRDRFAVGDRIYTVVRELDRDTGRMYVSHKELLGTWEENAAAFRVGTTVTGVVRSIESYGIFVELAPNLAGLAEYAENVSAGSCASVYIKNVLPDKMKIKLVLIDSFPSPERQPPVKYFIDGARVGHISYWRYSPPDCAKVVESVFDPET